MEIRVKAEMRGERLRENILQRWGSRKELETQAERGDGEAKEDLFTLDRLEEDPRRLEARHERTTVSTVEPEVLSRLTETRVALLDVIAASEEALNVSELARASSRDKKNVSEDLELLEELGFVERISHGREKRIRLRGSKISIELTSEHEGGVLEA